MVVFESFKNGNPRTRSAIGRNSPAMPRNKKHRRFGFLLLLAMLVAGRLAIFSGGRAKGRGQPVRFADVTLEAGIHFKHVAAASDVNTTSRRWARMRVLRLQQ